LHDRLGLASHTLTGTIADFTAAVQDGIKAKVATELSVPSSEVTLAIVPASVRMTISVAVASFATASTASTAAAALAAQMTSTDAASTSLSTSTRAVTVESIVAFPSVVDASASESTR